MIRDRDIAGNRQSGRPQMIVSQLIIEAISGLTTMSTGDLKAEQMIAGSRLRVIAMIRDIAGEMTEAQIRLDAAIRRR
jgi:hypothetical protein